MTTTFKCFFAVQQKVLLPHWNGMEHLWLTSIRWPGWWWMRNNIWFEMLTSWRWLCLIFIERVVPKLAINWIEMTMTSVAPQTHIRARQASRQAGEPKWSDDNERHRRSMYSSASDVVVVQSFYSRDSWIFIWRGRGGPDDMRWRWMDR